MTRKYVCPKCFKEYSQGEFIDCCGYRGYPVAYGPVLLEKDCEHIHLIKGKSFLCPDSQQFYENMYDIGIKPHWDIPGVVSFDFCVQCWKISNMRFNSLR